jgi:hypothetical protein
MAAMIAITLYMEIPRVAFETQRQKEELLVERGEQYKRAIKLFVSPRGAGRWPATVAELESFNNRRYLRHRFIDPMTGKDDWRLVHIQNGMLTDSANSKPAQPGDQSQKQAATTAGQYVGEQAGLGQTLNQPGGQNTNLALRRRSSDNAAANTMYPAGSQPVGPDGQPVPGADPTANAGNLPAQQTFPGAMPGQPGAYAPGVPGQMGQSGMPGMPGQPMPGGMPGQPPIPGLPGFPQGGLPGATAGGTTTDAGSQSYIGGGYGMGSQQTVPSQQPMQTQSPFPGQAGFPGQQAAFPGATNPTMPGATGTGAQGMSAGMGSQGVGAQGTGTQGMTPDGQNAAAAMIGDLLRQPRPTGMPTGNGTGGSNNVIGGGIAGIASKADSGSIMVYSDHSNYKEWEFIYDPMKDRPPPNPLTGAGIPAAQLGNTSGQSSPGTPASQLGSTPQGNQGSSFGSSSSFGNSSGFGNSTQPMNSFGQNSGRQ